MIWLNRVDPDQGILHIGCQISNRLSRQATSDRCVHAKYFLCLTGDHSVCKTGFVVKPVTSMKLWVHTILFLSVKCKCLNVARIFNFWTQRLINVLSVGSSRIFVASRKTPLQRLRFISCLYSSLWRLLFAHREKGNTYPPCMEYTLETVTPDI